MTGGSSLAKRFSAPVLAMALVTICPQAVWAIPSFARQTNLSCNACHNTEFNGARTNYDGFGRNASDNNTLYAVFWIAF